MVDLYIPTGKMALGFYIQVGSNRQSIDPTVNIGHSTCQKTIVIFFKTIHIMLNANVDGRIDRLGGVVPLRIDDRLEPLPQNRPSLSEPSDAEIEISPPM